MEEEQNQPPVEEKKSGMGYVVMGVIAVVIVVGLIIFAQGKKSTPSPASVQQPSAQEKNTVIYSDSGFSPASLSIKQGETVTFKNESSEEMWVASAMHPVHSDYDGTTLSEHCAAGASPSFDACKALAKGESYSFKFDKVGTWKYHNHMNPTKFGSITVE